MPQSVVWHLGGGTLPNDSPWKLKLNYRNNLLMLQNNLAKTYSLQEVKELTPDKGGRQSLQARQRDHIHKKMPGRVFRSSLSTDRKKRLLQVGLGGTQGIPEDGGQT